MSKHTAQIQGRDYNGIRIRDQIHGDILLPEKFMEIVDSWEFQRLRYVKQLATAQYAFPGAMHTRFAHSIGTFHVMQQILNHFERYFNILGQDRMIDQSERDLILAASLLHDLGHTPFSHALEDSLSNAKKVPHEQWTVDLIKDKKGELFKVLNENFGNGSPEKIANLILLQHDDVGGPFFPASDIKLENIFHSLISSQLDADRLDYIRRDSQALGLSYGLIDIDRLISGFRIGILDDGKATVCVAEENLADVEGYLYARYQMYRNVYLNPFKMLTEELLRKIIRFVYELYDHDKLKITDLPVGFKAALQKAAMENEDFISLDDYVILGAVKGWSKLQDRETQVLRELCQSLLARKGFHRYQFADISPVALEQFKHEVTTLVKKYMQDTFKAKYEGRDDSEWINEFPFLVVRVEYPQLYKSSADKIYILENSGRLVDIADCSNLVRAFLPVHGSTQGFPGAAVSAIYFNPDLLGSYLGQESVFGKLGDETIQKIKGEVKKMFNSRDARNSIEIEKKYHIPLDGDDSGWDEVQRRFCDFLKKEGYEVQIKGAPTGEEQTDYYFDTADERLYRKHCSLRIRRKAGKAEITCKRPVEGSRSCGGQGQMERYEYAGMLKDVHAEDLVEVCKSEDDRTFVDQHVADLVDIRELEKTIIVKNMRTRYIVSRQVETAELQQITESYELAFDSVQYTNCKNRRQHSEKQVEIELKSDPVMRLNMQLLTNRLEKELSALNLEIMTESKYERAKRFTTWD